MLEQKKQQPVVVVLGGYGNFGKRLCYELAEKSNLTLVIAGRNLNKANALKQNLQNKFPSSCIHTLELNKHAHDIQQKLLSVQATLLVHTAGPFQAQDYRVANACIDANVHYIDIADSREHVINISALDNAALEKQLIIISGASLVPGLISTIVDTYSLRFSTLLNVDFGISTGNRVERGMAALKSSLVDIGQPFQQLHQGQWQTVYGWQKTHRTYFGDNLGLRWQSQCDAPDLFLIPKRYPKIQSVKFYVGIELGVMHFIFWLLSWLVRWKIINNLSIFAKIIKKLSRLCGKLGTSKGGIFVHLYGTDFEYQPYEIHWQLVTETAHELNISVTPTLIVIEKILNNLLLPGAQPCTNLFSMDEFDAYAAKWNIYHTTDEKKM